MDRDTCDTIAIEENGEMNKEFTELIELAVGPNRTKLQFAQETGISQVHLTRLTKNAGKPTLDTLRKIAAHSEGRVTITMLKSSLGMEITRDDEKEDIEAIPVERRNAIKAEDIKKGITELCLKKPCRYDSLEDLFVDTLDLIYGYAGMNYELPEGMELANEDSKKHRGAEKYADVNIRWNDNDCTCEMALIVFFCETANGGIIVTDAAYDLETLYKFDNELSKKIKEGMIPETEISVSPDLVYVTTKKATSEKFDATLKKIQTDREELILNNIDEFSDELSKYAVTKQESDALENIIKRFMQTKSEK